MSRPATSNTTREPPPTRAARGAWWERAVVWGLAISFFVHMALGLGAADYLLGGAPLGDAGEGEIIELALENSGETLAGSGQPEAGGGALDRPPDFTAELLEQPEITVEDVPSALGPLETTALAQRGAGLTGAGTVGAGGGAGVGGEGGLGGKGLGQARFFGVEARGSRFVYIVDVSGSMGQANRLNALKAALVSSISALLEHTSFCIIAYASEARPITGIQWMKAGEREKEEARSLIAAIRSSGGTNPLPAFDVAFSLKPAPDAIYFMTDGQFPGEVEQKITSHLARLNRAGDRVTPVHCISFMNRGAEPIMRRLARISGGTYTHVQGQDP